MSKYPCRDCEERHFACWDRCERYQKSKKVEKPKDEYEGYVKEKGDYYKTQFGWRR